LAAELWHAHADQHQVEVAILNLVLNARDAMPLGGTITIETANVPAGHPRLPPPLGASGGDFVLLALSDNGSGMSESVVARAFEPFFTTKEVGKGTGLGLSAVHGVAQQSGGTATIRSRLGEGTTVSIFLPRATRVTTSGAAPDAPRPLERAVIQARILLVDDDSDVREFVAASLRTLGHQVIERETGWSAIEALQDDAEIDLLIVDYAMPALNGAEVARRVGETRPSLPILLITGYTDAQSIDLPAGVVTLKKPFRIAELERLVTEARGAAHAAEATQSNVHQLRPGS
jgi:CheY-like chemotaxis protein